MRILLTLALVSLIGVQDPPQKTGQTFRSGTDLVEVDVRVIDKDGHFVTGLSPDDFTLEEDGAAQKIGQETCRRRWCTRQAEQSRPQSKERSRPT